MSEATTYKLEALAREAGTSARTVRYYVQRGLLPAPAFRGKDTGYGEEHLVRLRAIRRLQEAYLPLDAIAAELAGRSLEAIGRIAEGDLGGVASVVGTSPAAGRRGGSAESESESDAASELPLERPGGAGARGDRAEPFGAEVAFATFQRLVLAPGVELTVAEDAPRASRRVVEEILRSLKLDAEREGKS